MRQDIIDAKQWALDALIASQDGGGKLLKTLKFYSENSIGINSSGIVQSNTSVCDCLDNTLIAAAMDTNPAAPAEEYLNAVIGHLEYIQDQTSKALIALRDYHKETYG